MWRKLRLHSEPPVLVCRSLPGAFLTLGTLERAARILDLFTPARSEWGASEVARALQLPTSSAHLTLSSLARTGLLHRTVAGRHRLGFKLLSLYQTLLTNTPWRDVAQDEMAALARRCGESVGLKAFDGGQLVHMSASWSTCRAVPGDWRRAGQSGGPARSCRPMPAPAAR